MDKEELLKMINQMVGAGEADPADETTTIMYKRGQDGDYSLMMEITGKHSGIFAAICEITTIWSLRFKPEEREEQIRYVSEACIEALKDEEYVNTLKRYMQVN